MSLTDVSICNMALARIGDRVAIQRLDEKSPNSNKCNLVFDHVRTLLLSNYSWGFAKNYLAMSDAGTPVGKWSYMYSRPNKIIKIIGIYDANELQHEYEVASVNDVPVVLTNLVGATLVYIKDVTVPIYYTPLFSELFILAVAYRISSPTSRKSSVRQEIKAELMDAHLKASAFDANQKHVDTSSAELPSWLKNR